jgi:hypothetical protein
MNSARQPFSTLTRKENAATWIRSLNEIGGANLTIAFRRFANDAAAAHRDVTVAEDESSAAAAIDPYHAHRYRSPGCAFDTASFAQFTDQSEHARSSNAAFAIPALWRLAEHLRFHRCAQQQKQ